MFLKDKNYNLKTKELYKLYLDSFLIDTDTRSIRKNSLFFALKGPNFNGNQFAETALKKGAIYSIICLLYTSPSPRD